MRLVSFRKAILAGVMGALAWEAVIGLSLAAGVPLFDLPKLLGTLMVGRAPAWLWWPAGMLLHMAVGAIWAIFYAYFFFYTFDWRPALQGMAFSAGPCLLAGLVMMPQLALMHPLIVSGEMKNPGLFASGAGWGGPVSIVVGHLVYGAVMGAMYTHPVGSPIRKAEAHG